MWVVGKRKEMKEFKKLFAVSFKNLKCHKWLNARIVIALSVFMFIICLFSIFYVSTGLMYARYPAEHVSANYIFSREEITDLPEGTHVTTIKMGEYSSRLISLFGEKKPGQVSPYILFYDRISIELEGKEYQFYRNNFLDYLGTSSNFNVFSLSENFFTENDYAELKLRFGLDSFIIGELPQTSNEILISAEMLGYYSLNPEDVVGKKVTFNYSYSAVLGGEDVNYGPVWEPFTVTGVIRQEYNQLYGHNLLDRPTSGWFCVPSVVMMPDAEAFTDLDNYGTIFYRYSLNDWSREINDKYSLWYDYCGAGVFAFLDSVERVQSIMHTLFLVLGICLGGGMLLTIYLLTDKFIRHFARNGGTLLAGGLSERQLKISVLIQVLFLCLIAMVASFALTTFVYWGLSVGAVKFSQLLSFVHLFKLNEIFVLNSMLFIILLLVELVVVALVALCLMLNILLFTKKKSIKELLNTSTD